MAEEYEDDEFWDDELSPEDIADLKRSLQDANMGFTFTTVTMENGGWGFKCNKCKRIAEIRERPFPHKFDCPMRTTVKD
jgi:hypothetical protein